MITNFHVLLLFFIGNCPGLFSLSELSAICGELIPGGQRGKRNENLAIAQERFLRRVRTNLRVALSLEHPSNRTHALNVFKFSLYPFLSTRASGVDVYQPWHHNTLAKVSSMRLEDIDMDSDLQDIVDIHLTSVTSVMSFIHRSTLETIAKQFAFNRYKCYSPGTFVEFVDMFGKCCNRIWREEQVWGFIQCYGLYMYMYMYIIYCIAWYCSVTLIGMFLAKSIVYGFSISVVKVCQFTWDI